ncbi:MAG: topoisomerase DNA-binding C4 zinc finger domain-containing protein [Desulfosarcinaceae bacterium]|nr:topoisomerase DNA-binding C4 zinc finger domain-containing protein [Desulfosarcinaceae bacterium]
MVQTDEGCPACGSTATYRYGRASNGKRRRLCLLCNRQYIVDRRPMDLTPRPACPKCGQPMHRYRQQGGIVRYRCRNYPACRTYVKVARKTAGSSPTGGPA